MTWKLPSPTWPTIGAAKGSCKSTQPVDASMRQWVRTDEERLLEILLGLVDAVLREGTITHDPDQNNHVIRTGSHKVGQRTTNESRTDRQLGDGHADVRGPRLPVGAHVLRGPQRSLHTIDSPPA